MTASHAPRATQRTVRIPARYIPLVGTLSVPEDAHTLVILVQSAGSSRRNVMSQEFADELNEEGIATLLADLLTPEEQALDSVTEQLRNHHELLATRLGLVTDWVRAQPETRDLHIGYHALDGAAGAALTAAVRSHGVVEAVVIRRGLPHAGGMRGFVGESLPPTLFIVSDEPQAIEANTVALRAIAAREKDLVIVPRASAAFTEPGAAELAAQHAMRWFERHLVPSLPPCEAAADLC